MSRIDKEIARFPCLACSSRGSKGLKKNAAQCFTLFALANLVIAKKHLLV